LSQEQFHRTQGAPFAVQNLSVWTAKDEDSTSSKKIKAKPTVRAPRQRLKNVDSASSEAPALRKTLSMRGSEKSEGATETAELLVLHEDSEEAESDRGRFLRRWEGDLNCCR